MVDPKSIVERRSAQHAPAADGSLVISDEETIPIADRAAMTQPLLRTKIAAPPSH
jgi:hypothetical protein